MVDPLWLALETSSLTGSVAVARGGDALASEQFTADRRDANRIMPAIRDLLAAHGAAPRDLAAFAFSTGPGSFTGLRIAATVARLLHSVVGCPIIAASTLAVVARNALPHVADGGRVVPVIDAKRGQVYAAVYERTGDVLVERTPPGIFDPATWLPTLQQPVTVVGEGLKHHAETCAAAAATVLSPKTWPARATELVAVAWPLFTAQQFCPPAKITPLYLRPPECEEVYEQRRAAARVKRGE